MASWSLLFVYAVGQEVILRKTLLDKYEADVFFFFSLFTVMASLSS